MLVYGLFQTSLALEIGINELNEQGFNGDRLSVVVLNAISPGKQAILDSMYRTDGMSLVDGIVIAASIGMIMGVIYGSVVYIGPIALGLVGMVVGGVMGYLLDRLINKRKQQQNEGTSSSGEVIVVVHCIDVQEAKQVENIMKKHQAVALGREPGVLKA